MTPESKSSIPEHQQRRSDEYDGIRVFHNEDDQNEAHEFCSQAQKIQQLAGTFHSLWGIEGIWPWDVRLIATDSIHQTSSAARQALLFVLSVWNPETPVHYDLEPFDIHHALKVWDERNRQAFLTWAQSPWWA